ncbi:hypothetical protein AAGS40_16130 [Paraburkholderia sp. PREW-6R]|uniref:hypothetical protein n=1 Tax=Paraburkholderia sp. PREW-6R TaxID=3141544 RepID=UPI0031F591DC
MLTSHFWSGDALRSRTVSPIVLTQTLDVPAPPARLLADWERETSKHVLLDPGDVEPMPLARALMRWPDYSRCVRIVADWTRAQGLTDVLATSDIALMACRGARYHHDGAQYGSAAFCNLFMSEDKGLDLHFPALDLRIPLTRGTAVVFDTGQPHGVIRRGSSGFSAADFAAHEDRIQIFLTWELAIEDAAVASTLGVTFDVDPAASPEPDEEQLRLDGERVEVCSETGQWLRAHASTSRPSPPVS